MRELEQLLDGGTFFEGARWHEGRWWVSDFYANRVIAVDPGGEVEEVMSIEQPSGLGWLPDGSLLAVSMTGHKLWRQSTATASRPCTPTSPRSRAARPTTWWWTRAAAPTWATTATT